MRGNNEAVCQGTETRGGKNTTTKQAEQGKFKITGLELGWNRKLYSVHSLLT